MKRKYCSIVLVVLSFLFSASNLVAEGTKQLIPDPSKNQGALQIWDGGAGSSALRTFLTYNSAADPLKRLNFRIKNAGEKVYLGISAQNNDVFFRIKDKDGNSVPLLRISTTSSLAVITAVSKPINYNSLYVNSSGVISASGISLDFPNQFTYRMPYNSSMTGFISNYNEATNGPAVTSVANANGYSVSNGYKNPFFFIATNPGDYFIEANPIFPDTVISSGAYSTMTNRRFPFIDVTITDANDKIQIGRLWSGFWDITLFSFTNLFNGSFYMYTTDSMVTKLKMKNIQPFGFLVIANSFGLTQTGDFAKDRQSRAGIFQTPEYKLFLNNPDSILFPTGRLGEFTGPPYVSGCGNNAKCINISVSKAGKAHIQFVNSYLNNQTSGFVDKYVFADLKAGDNCIPWDGKDGAGNEIPLGPFLPIRIDYFSGLTHLPLYDCERNLNGINVSLVRPGRNIVGYETAYLFWDDTQIPLAKINKASSADATVYPGSLNIPIPWLGDPISNPECGTGALNNGNPTGYSPYSNILTTSTGQCLMISNGCQTVSGCMNGLQMLNDVQGCNNPDGCHKWNWNSNNSTSADYGNVNTINTWWYSNILSTVFGVRFAFIKANAEIRIPSIISKTRDTTLYPGNYIYTLNGFATTSGQSIFLKNVWRTNLPKSLQGTFSDSTSLNSTYTPSTTDLSRDSVKVYLYVYFPDCNSGALDSLIIRYSKVPKIILETNSNEKYPSPSIYPNPMTSDELFVGVEKSSGIKVFDAVGSEINAQINYVSNALIKVILPQSSSGVYYISIQREDNHQFVKVIK